jgi:uncharacterized protein YndB with AHSA1/START domain
MKSVVEPIVVEQTFNATLETVWKAITDVELMKQWYFNMIPSFKPEVGFETKFNVESGGRNFLHMWKVTEVIPFKRISYNWKYEGIPGDSFLVFELLRQNERTSLRHTHQVTESFPEDIPEFKRESGVDGWNYFIKKSLKEFLENN